MDFINEPFDIRLLPKAEDVPLTPIEKAYLLVIRIEWGISATVLLITGTVLIFSVKSLQHPVWIFSIFAGLIALAFGYAVVQTKSFSQKAYALRDKDVIYRSGWIVQKTHTCPFNRIQHSSVTTGFFERKYGLATLILYTAGTDETDLQIPGLKEADAYAMKEWITQQIIHEEQPGA
ncbi:MAG: PH domain-containing protein [Chitinophagaceae bacterium]|nr:PH domain-containing protein [Chitinophagaceae bacterium]